jgi:hypothetical protein
MDVNKLIPNSNFSCVLCGTKCTSISAVKRHVKYKQGESKICQCPFPGCVYKASRPDTLNRHYLTIHRNQDTNLNFLKEMRITQVNEMSDTPQDTNAPSSMDTNTDLQSVISPYIQQMSDNILDMDIPKLMDSQQVLSIETRNTPQSYPSITNDNNNITSLTIQVPVISNDVSKVTLQKDGVPNITVQDQGISNMRSQDPGVSIVSTNDTCVSNVTLQDPCVSIVSINDTGASNVTLQDPSVSIASLQYPCVPEGTLHKTRVYLTNL